MKIDEAVEALILARRALGKASRGQVDPDGVEMAKENLAHFVSEISDEVGRLEEEWLNQKAIVFNREINSGASTDAAGKRMSGETKSYEATVAKLNRLVKDGSARIINAQSILKRFDHERNT